MNQEELLAVVADSWRQLDAAIDDLDDAAMTEPGVVEEWSVKDLLGHVTTWERVALRHMERARQGESPADLEGTVDEYNAREAATRRTWSPAQVRQEAAQTRERLRAALASVSDDDWAAVWGEGEGAAPLSVWVGGALGGPDGPATHAAEHARQIPGMARRAWAMKENGVPRRHFVQYHNPDKMGHTHELSDDFCILTGKPYSMLAALPGNVVWLIGGEGRPRAYSLCSVFVVDEIGESDEPGFRWYASGTIGRLFRPLLRIDHDPWFGYFLHRNANFSLGLRALDEADVAHLQRLSGICPQEKWP